ncbi:MAG: hypothetical protein MUP30_06610 [Deltaproteobacteria bacterium]|nr:hypothetical protein [Deltaproteobacteria bacterium]
MFRVFSTKKPEGDTAKQPIKDSANQAVTLTGRWVWVEDSEEANFSVTIKKEGNAYIGSYCAVALSGNRIDCDDNDPPAFVIKDLPGNEFTVNFKTYYGQGTGKVKIRIEGEKMYWEVVEKPKGQYFCPNVAVLKRGIR